jgi:hypothetical protein
MADFFGNLQGFRFPDARINGGGPLPTDLSGPEGISGDPDGRINFNHALLEGIKPYSGPDTGRISSDRNYQQIPHRRQFFVPKLWLPAPDGNSKFELSHAVDQGDLAFILRLHDKSFVLYESSPPAGQGDFPNVSVLVNLATANYIMAGVHRWWLDANPAQRLAARNNNNGVRNPNLWAVMAAQLLFRHWQGEEKLAHALLQAFIPMGICAGSEKQGGLHETGLAPVQAACSHVTTLTLDGQNRDLVNMWQHCDVGAGDVLILRLCMVQGRNLFVLNHYYKGVVTQIFPARADHVFQIVPDILFMGYNWATELQKDNPGAITDAQVLARPRRVNNPAHHAYDYMGNGYWRVAQTFTHKRKFRTDKPGASDTDFLKGQLLQVTFAPVWCQYGEQYGRRPGALAPAPPFNAVPAPNHPPLAPLPVAGNIAAVPAAPAAVAPAAPGAAAPAEPAAASEPPAAASPAAASEPPAAEPAKSKRARRKDLLEYNTYED